MEWLIFALVMALALGRKKADGSGSDSIVNPEAGGSGDGQASPQHTMRKAPPASPRRPAAPRPAPPATPADIRDWTQANFDAYNAWVDRFNAWAASNGIADRATYAAPPSVPDEDSDDDPGDPSIVEQGIEILRDLGSRPKR